ncbi:hypothetical protein AAHH78_38660, partial [Burkholderia pseudomallei]
FSVFCAVARFAQRSHRPALLGRRAAPTARPASRAIGQTDRSAKKGSVTKGLRTVSGKSWLGLD